MIDFFELLDDYVEGRLDLELKDQFDNELKKNLSLQKAVENYPLAKKISKSMIELETREQILELKSKKNYFFLYLKVAAFIVLLVCIGLLHKLNIDSERVESEQIFASLYSEPQSSSSRSGSYLASKLDSAILLFDKHEFGASKNLFSSIIKEDSSSALSLRYLAHIAIQEKNYTSADSIFNSLSKCADSNLQIEAQFNLMILAIRRNDKSAAKRIYQTFFKEKKWIENDQEILLNEWMK